MRIISGKLKGKSINFLKNTTTRPLKDSVKENIFNILEHSNLMEVRIQNANVLDLYSGIGSFGLECISRGAKKTTFIEQDFNSFKILKKNSIELLIDDQVNIIHSKIENNLILNKKGKYNIFFLDPPFSDDKFIVNLRSIQEKRIYMKKHVVIIHREKSSNDNFDNIMNILLTKKYARSKIKFGTFI